MKRFSLLFCAMLGFVLALSADEPAVHQTFMVPMRDQVHLATDLYVATTNQPFPVVLMRTPYGKARHSAEAAGIVKQGYALVVQDTRGRFGSEGENLPFYQDDRDGADTVAWITQQGWCNGKIGTYGGSALGITQLQLAEAGIKNLACQFIIMAGPSLFDDVVYHGGVFRKALAEDWLRASQFSPEALRLWTGHSTYDSFWQQRDVSLHYAEINTPAVHVGGYFDIFAQGTIDAFLGYQNHGGTGARGKQKLLMGPWVHGGLSDRAGDLKFVNGSAPPGHIQDRNKWWECYLKGVVNGVADWPAVTYYVMGDAFDTNAPGNTWRTAQQWPPVPTRQERWYLHPDQSLSQTKPAQRAELAYQYDPRDPVPTVGGYELTIPAGPKDQKLVEDRADVLVFTSAPLDQPKEVTGNVQVKLYAHTDVPDTDFIARLCDVYPDGRSFNICEGVIRARFRNSYAEPALLVPERTYAIKIMLWPTSIIFNRGHRLRVDIASSSAPAYDPNPNTGEPLRWSDRKRVAHMGIKMFSPHRSYVDLPVAQ